MTWSGAVLAGFATAVAVGGWYGLAAGVSALVVVRPLLARLEPRDRRRERRRLAADLPYLIDLLAAGLRAGLPLERVVRLVADATSGPGAQRLARVERSLALGLPLVRAWEPLADSAGGARLLSAVSRSADSGAALAVAFERLADELRAGRASAAEAAARRVGVLIVLPLGLCFLPAFIFAGVAPVIIAVLGDVLH